MTEKNEKNNENIQKIEEALQTVYDPEMPIIDIYNMGLIYDYSTDENEKQVFILMTLTSPACPVGDMIVDMAKEAINVQLPDYKVEIEMTFEPMWSPSMIKDEDLKRMFE